MTGGQFKYPPPNSEDVTLNYNYRDSVEVSFETTTDSKINPYLSLWYYLNGKSWALGYNTSVPANGTITVDLNVLDEAYYGQFNFDDGSSVLYLSCFFNVAYNTTQSPTTWGQSAAAAWSSSLAAATATTSSSSSSSSSSTSISKTTSTTSSTISTTSATSSPTITSAATQIATPSSTASSSSSLSSGAIAGIAVGVVIGVLALLGMGIFFWWRNRNANKSSLPSELPGVQPSPHQQTFSSDNRQAEKTRLVPYSDYQAHNRQTTDYAELAGNHALQELP